MSIFTRDRPGTTDPAVAEAFASAEIPYGDSVPAGTYLDMTANLPVVQPEKVLAPVLLIRGEFDGIATLEDIMAFYSKLPNGDRQLVIVPGAAHSLGTCLHRNAFFHASRAFLTQPTAPS
jgi:dipeptidyl aminopeptidase/acylaminoacyl peptidase